jgi:cell division protein FtsL
MIDCEGGLTVTTEVPDVTESHGPSVDVKTMGRGEKVRRWLIIVGTVVLAVFLVYLLLVLVYPSLNIGVNP